MRNEKEGGGDDIRIAEVRQDVSLSPRTRAPGGCWGESQTNAKQSRGLRLRFPQDSKSFTKARTAKRPRTRRVRLCSPRKQNIREEAALPGFAGIGCQE